MSEAAELPVPVEDEPTLGPSLRDLLIASRGVRPSLARVRACCATRRPSPGMGDLAGKAGSGDARTGPRHRRGVGGLHRGQHPGGASPGPGRRADPPLGLRPSRARRRRRVSGLSRGQDHRPELHRGPGGRRRPLQLHECLHRPRRPDRPSQQPDLAAGGPTRLGGHRAWLRRPRRPGEAGVAGQDLHLPAAGDLVCRRLRDLGLHVRLAGAGNQSGGA